MALHRPQPPEHLLRWQSLALEIHRDVRVIPQTHVMLGQLWREGTSTALRRTRAGKAGGVAWDAEP